MGYAVIKRIVIGFLVFLVTVTFVGCANKELIYEKFANHTNVVEDSTYGKIKIDFDTLDGENVRAFEAKIGKVYEFKYEYNILNGDIKIIITDSKENILGQTKWNSEEEQDIKKDEGETVKVNGSGGVIKVRSVDGKIRIVVDGKEASGNLKIEW